MRIAKIRLPSLALALALAPAAGGCLPSDAEIDREMTASRREAYTEWKARRDRGESAEAQVDGPLSLNDAVKLALRYNKSLQAALQEREITRGNRIADYQVILPSLSLSGGADRNETGRGNSDISDVSAGLSVRQPIFEGEAIPARLRAARLNTALTDETIRGDVQTLIQNVASNYYDILLSQHMVETHSEALASATAQYRMVSEKKKQETATDYDLLRAQVDVATCQARVISARNSVDANRVALLKNMGVSQDSAVTFSDRLEFLPMRPVFERAVELASGNRPDLRTAELTARIDAEAVRIARSAWWPSVSGSFQTAWRDGWGADDSFGRNPWSAGLSASYTLGIANAGDLIAAKARAKQSQIDILDRQELALKEIRDQMNNLANAEEMVKALEVNQDAAREALRLVLVGYQAGVKTDVDVTDARSALTDVQGQYYGALTDHTKARLNLQVAMGILGPSRVADAPLLPPSVPIANITEFAATDYVPPAPVVLPTAEDLTPARRTASPATAAAGAARGQAGKPAKAGQTAQTAQTAKPARPTAEVAPSSRQPAQRPAPVQTVPVPAMSMPAAAEPAILPTPVPAAPVQTAAVQAAPAAPLPMPPVAEAAVNAAVLEPAEPAVPRPLFRIKVRSPGSTDIASATRPKSLSD